MDELNPLRKLRLEACLTIQQLAEMADLSPEYIGNLERGSAVAGILARQKLLGALKVPLERHLEVFGAFPG